MQRPCSTDTSSSGQLHFALAKYRLAALICHGHGRRMQAVIEISCPTASHPAAGYHAQGCLVQRDSVPRKRVEGNFILTVTPMTRVAKQDMTLHYGLQPRTGLA